ncbi:Fat-like cadherin-related tumor suppressor [Araneus ventricosus]|uniref:Fat-like cadherin-related tumor suppressor n=1 Tax=Araneus ventricosus TaxID=182803 RepID=A0A4Y2JHI3_ARAVE|nr:Fat-like cadherin-related tumor suppressor [Araneus ventricosus]
MRKEEYEERKRKDEMEFELQKIYLGAEDDWSKLNSPDDLIEKLDDYDTLRSTCRSKQPRKEGHYDKRNSFKDDPVVTTNEKRKMYGITHNDRACYCENGNCVNEGGKETCKCNPGYGNYKGTSCRACGCGPDTDCMWQSGFMPLKTCFCKPGYAQLNNECVACNCGPDSNCTFIGVFQKKKCICKPGHWEVDRKCVGPCTSDPCKNNGICEVEGKGFKCNCSKPWRGKTCEIGPCDKQPCQNGGTCNNGKIGFICKCVAPFSGPRCENGLCTSNPCQNNGICEVSEDSYRCNCNKPFKGTNCELECDCGPYGTCSLESGMKRCICHSNYAEKNGKCEYCFCGENSKSCRYNVLGEKECNCSYAYAQNRGYCEVMESTTLECSTSTRTTVLPSTTQYKGTSPSEGTTHSTTTSTIVSSTVQACDCGLGGSCNLDSSGDKICYCFSGYARYKGHCYECDCGPYGTCIIDAGIKRCICDFNYAEKNGRCECK